MPVKPFTRNKMLRLAPFFMLIMLVGMAQNNQPPDFIPAGYTIFNTTYGDLNHDGQNDCVLIIKKTDPSQIVTNRFDQVVDRNRRGILVLFKTRNGYQLASKNYSCFSSENEDGGVYFAPEMSVEIDNNKLYIYYAHGRYGYWKYTFRFQNSNFELIGFDSSSNQGPVVNTVTSINFLTKKKLVKENTNLNAEGQDELFKETWSAIQIAHLIKLWEILDFDTLQMFDY